MDRVCVVIPAYNDWDSVQRLLPDLGAAGVQNGVRLHVMIVDDSSTIPAPESWPDLTDSAIDSLKVFATVYVTTAGGPNHATEVLSTWAFFQAFSGNEVGYGSAILVVLLAVTLSLAYLYTSRIRDAEDRS